METTKEKLSEERPIADLQAADAFRDTMLQLDDVRSTAPLWHGWVIEDAYLAGLDAGRAGLEQSRHALEWIRAGTPAPGASPESIVLFMRNTAEEALRRLPLSRAVRPTSQQIEDAKYLRFEAETWRLKGMSTAAKEYRAIADRIDWAYDKSIAFREIAMVARNAANGAGVVRTAPLGTLPGSNPVTPAPADPRDARIKQLEDAVRWACDEIGEFRLLIAGEGNYFWRTELLGRAGLEANR